MKEFGYIMTQNAKTPKMQGLRGRRFNTRHLAAAAIAVGGPASILATAAPAEAVNFSEYRHTLCAPIGTVYFGPEFNPFDYAVFLSNRADAPYNCLIPATSPGWVNAGFSFVGGGKLSTGAKHSAASIAIGATTRSVGPYCSHLGYHHTHEFACSVWWS